MKTPCGPKPQDKTALAQITWLRALWCVIATIVTSYVCDGPATRQLSSLLHHTNLQKGSQQGSHKWFLEGGSPDGA